MFIIGSLRADEGCEQSLAKRQKVSETTVAFPDRREKYGLLVTILKPITAQRLVFDDLFCTRAFFSFDTVDLFLYQLTEFLFVYFNRA